MLTDSGFMSALANHAFIDQQAAALAGSTSASAQDGIEPRKGAGAATGGVAKLRQILIHPKSNHNIKQGIWGRGNLSPSHHRKILSNLDWPGVRVPLSPKTFCTFDARFTFPFCSPLDRPVPQLLGLCAACCVLLSDDCWEAQLRSESFGRLFWAASYEEDEL